MTWTSSSANHSGPGKGLTVWFGLLVLLAMRQAFAQIYHATPDAEPRVLDNLNATILPASRRILADGYE
ncbi:MAG: hypothetical protein LBU46_08055 [Candidatus Accumulibacter sp.]|jgi:hypothetical protein|nr:hypothetical protein [Accumulibacter sp.]